MANKKVEILIFLDESGHVGARYSSHNLITILGVIELAKNAILKQSELEQESNIVIPQVN